MRFLSVLLLCGVLFPFPNTLSAQTVLIPTSDIDNGFNPHAILDDQDIFEIKMGYNELRQFLASRGALGRITVTDIDGTERAPADVIWRVANTYKINPQYLLVLLQKEQSLVEDPAPSERQLDWATGFAVCDSCSKDDPRIQDFKGFANQVEWAAKQHREKYLQQLLAGGTTISGYAPGITTIVDGMSITPRNRATAMLYTYTPHIHGNLNLWRIWRRWFEVDLPDGTVVRAVPSGDIYLIRFGLKRRFRSPAVAAGIVDIDKAIEVTDEKMLALPPGEPISFPNYSIIHLPDGTRYLIVGDTKRHIKDMDVFRSLGFTEDDVLDAAFEEAESYELGRDITSETEHPTGILAQDPAGVIWYVEDGTKSRIPHPIFLSLYFRGRNPRLMGQQDIDRLETVETYRLRDGELIKGENYTDVYVVEHGLLRPIISGEIFELMGWKWHNLVVLPDKFIETYPKGEMIAPPEPSESEDEAVVLTHGRL